jgi:mono/diheme cytochrome c family protein
MNRVCLTRWRRLLCEAGAALLLLLPIACQQRMAAQPSYKPLDPDEFFDDGRSARTLVPGTVARGHLRTDIQFFTGKTKREPDVWLVPALVAVGAATSNQLLGATAMTVAGPDNDVTDFPFPVTREVLQHGYNRYMIYCVVCHDPLGTGRGKIVERGYTQPPSYHIERLRKVAVGHFFDVMTNGYGSMPDYREQIPPRDRWAIAAYIRALQLSQHFPENQLAPDERKKVQESKQSDALPAGNPSEDLRSWFKPQRGGDKAQGSALGTKAGLSSPAPTGRNNLARPQVISPRWGLPGLCSTRPSVRCPGLSYVRPFGAQIGRLRHAHVPRGFRGLGSEQRRAP